MGLGLDRCVSTLPPSVEKIRMFNQDAFKATLRCWTRPSEEQRWIQFECCNLGMSHITHFHQISSLQRWVAVPLTRNTSAYAVSTSWNIPTVWEMAGAGSSGRSIGRTTLISVLNATYNWYKGISPLIFFQSVHVDFCNHLLNFG